MTPALDAYLREVEARCEKATPGPWDWYNDGSVLLAGEPGAEAFPHVLGGEGDLYIEDGDADFIQHARTDLPLLLQLVRWQQEAIESVLKDSEHNPLAELLRHQPGSSYVKLEAVLARIERAIGEADGP